MKLQGSYDEGHGQEERFMQTIEQETIAGLERLLLPEKDSAQKPDAATQSTRNGSQRLSKLMIFGLGVAAAGLVAYSVPLLGSLNPVEQEPQELLTPIPQFQSTNDAFAPNNVRSTTMPMISTIHAVKTTITGVVDAETMTAAYYLSMFIHNTGTSNQEAQMKIRLPEGATVSRATLWIDGVAQEAAFNEANRVGRAYDWVTNGRHADPLLVRQLDKNTVLVKASPVVPGRAGMKLRIGITAPLQPSSRYGEVIGALPRITQRNFEDGAVDLHLDAANSGLPIARCTAPSLTEVFPPVRLQRMASAEEFAVPAKHSANGGYMVARVTRDAALPYMSIEKSLSMPNVPITTDEAAATRLSTLWAYNEIERLNRLGQFGKALDLARVYRVVSSVSAATVLELQSDYDRFSLPRNQWESISYPSTGSQSQAQMADSNSAPMLQGATNGTIEPQGMDAPVIQGVNTAGSVRVNNQSSLESELNTIGRLSGPIGSMAVDWSWGSTRDANLFDAPPSIMAAPLLLIPLAPLLALILLNFLPAVLLIVRSLERVVQRKPGAPKLLFLGAAWLALAILSPTASQVLSLITIIVLFRRKRLMQPKT
jgi:hypothetical protein